MQPALGLGEVSSIVLPVVSALEAASKLSLVHRDLKPDNIFLVRSERGEPAVETLKVLDFGIAKFAARDGVTAQSGTLTESGELLGTPYYMSPEQILGDQEIDHRSDIWALGVIAYECLAGVRPTDGATVGLVISRIIVKESIVSLERRRPDLPPDVCSIVQRALSFDRGDRPTLRELSQVFAQYANSSVAAPMEAHLYVRNGAAAPTLPVSSRTPRVVRWLGAGAAFALGALALARFRAGPERIEVNPRAASIRSDDLDAALAFFSTDSGAPASGASAPSGDLLAGWFLDGVYREEYEFVVDPQVMHGGKASGSLRSRVAKPQGGTSMTQMFSAASSRGKRVRFSAFIKAENVHDWAALWLDVYGPNGISAVDMMMDRPIDGTSDWTWYADVLDVAPDATAIGCGASLSGTGHIWMEGMKLETVGRDVPVTGRANNRPPWPRSPSWPEPPDNLDFGLPDASAEWRHAHPPRERPDASMACDGSAPETSVIVGLPSSPGQQPFTATSERSRDPTVEFLDPPVGSARPLHIVVKTGIAEDNRNWSVVGFMFAKPSCLDVSRFKGLRFKMEGDLGRCDVRFNVLQSHDMTGATDAGICTGERCDGYSFSSGALALGITELSFSDLKNSYPNPLDATALVGMQWGFVAPPYFPCKADIQITDVSFVER
jgi:hypothetical protein